MQRRKAVSLIAILLAVFLGFNAASAASIGVKTNNQLQSSKSIACMNTTLNTTTNSSNNLVVTDINAACFGKKITIQTLSNNTASAVIASVTVTASTMTSTAVVANPGTVTGAYGFVDGWFIPTTWNYQTPAATPAYVPPGYPTVTVTPTWNQTAATQFCATFNVTSTSATAVPWQVALTTSMPPFNGDLNPNNYAIPAPYALVSTTPVNGIFYVTGTTAASNTVKSGSPQNFQICNYNAPPPPIVSSATYALTQTSGAVTPSYYVCKTMQMTVTNTNFYAGWEANVDVTDLKNNFIPGGGSIQGPFGDFSKTSVSGNIWKIKGTGYTTWGVRPGNPVSFQICWS